MPISKHAFPVYSLRTELQHIQPLIWRRVWVPSSVVLERLHKIIQATMGWDDVHLHSFQSGRDTYQVPDPEYMDLYDDPPKDERGRHLDRLIDYAIREFRYVHDFGDHREHHIVVESLNTPNPTGAIHPVSQGSGRAHLKMSDRVGLRKPRGEPPTICT